MPDTNTIAIEPFFISIVDDDDSVRLALNRLVRSFGYAASSFSNVDDFLISSDFAKTHCLILDVQMSGLSGLDLQNILHALGSDIRIIFITGYQNEQVRERALELGAFGFLEKPFDDRTLLALIQNAQNQFHD